MDTRLSLLMMFLKSLLPAPGASLSPGLDPRCPAHTTISEDDEWANIGTLQNLKLGWGMDLFVHPDPGFKGVRLVAAGDGWQQDAWFTLDNTCFPLDARWWRLWGGVWGSRNDDNNNDGFLGFVVRTGDCYLRCRRTGHFLNAMNVTVVAHGPSRWILKYPRQCTVEEYKQDRYSWINCTSHPTTTTPTTTTTTTTTPTTTTTTTIAIIVVPVMIGVAVVVVLLVVLTKCYWQRRVNPDVRMRFQSVPASASESVVVENSLYKTLDNTRGTEVVENSLYETLDNTRGTEVVENSLYEPFENVRKPR
ncbi:uncharacterized protein LOC126991276 isoform X3 [Eriocheir sinensis]|uniref:uncharacterized protein LOC126991276 isoform X3 n=1 Tax=Eriocheir sinensis TaxID=95602 RepID=UPI0021C69836|nr:uncharacterized protein LOC126991276 isoform X3 [Eriocheir sinensis]